MTFNTLSIYVVFFTPFSLDLLPARRPFPLLLPHYT